MRRSTRHLVLFLTSVATVAAFHLAMASAPPVRRLSMATAYGSLVLIALSLSIGPWNKIRGRTNPVSDYLRRDVGIWAGILGIAHVIAGLQVHLHGSMLQYFLPPPDAKYAFPLRIDPFGLTNYAGLIATLILLLLLALSNNASLRALGAGRWKSLQRWNYAGAVLVIAHGVVYQVIEKRTIGFVVAFAVVVATASAMQFAGYRRSRAALP